MVDPGVGENRVERHCELASPVTNQESKVAGPITKTHEEVASLLSGLLPVRVGGGAEDVDIVGADLYHEEHIHPLQRDGTVDVEAARQHARRLSTSSDVTLWAQA